MVSLNHPNIASIFDLEEANGTKAMVMELVEGEDQSERIVRAPIPLEEALSIALQCGESHSLRVSLVCITTNIDSQASSRVTHTYIKGNIQNV